MVLALAGGVESALAVASGHAHVTPTAQVLAAAKSGQFVKVSVRVAFPIPAGASAANACSGKVTLHAPSGQAAWSGKPTSKAGQCAVTLLLKLPVSQFGKLEPFKLIFSGSERVAPFTRTLHIKIVPPSSPSTPTTGTPSVYDGHWVTSLQQPLGDTLQYFVLDVSLGKVIDSYLVNPSNFNCKPSGGEYAGWQQPTSQPFEIGNAGKFGGMFEYTYKGTTTLYGITGQLDAMTLTGTVDLTIKDAVCDGDMKGAIHRQ